MGERKWYWFHLAGSEYGQGILGHVWRFMAELYREIYVSSAAVSSTENEIQELSHHLSIFCFFHLNNSIPCVLLL